MTWQAASTFGWGILGLNVFCHWAVDPNVTPLMVVPIAQDDLRWMDPLRRAAIAPAVAETNACAARIAAAGADAVLQFDCPVIHGLGNGFAPTRFRGSANIGRLIFEDTRFRGFEARMRPYDTLLVASTWARDLVSAHATRPVHLIHEGIDASLFCPGPRSGLLDPSRFYVFSGGKIEYRKAQDLVVLAFRAFAARHPDAVLVTSWHSPWPKLSAGFSGRLAHPVTLDDQGRVDAVQWAVANGIPPSQVIDIGPIPNQLMPQVLREMDVSLQPSRAEACTNLPAKEAMACGVPVIVSDNTGTRDLLSPALADDRAGDGWCLPLRTQRPVSPPAGTGGTDGWGESDIDEIVEALEFVHANRDRGRAIGGRGSAWLRANGRTWGDHARALKALVLAQAGAA